MGRPKKQGLEYFTNDVTFYQDIKIRKLIRYKGIQAVPVYHILLCQIYTSGYYLQWDEDIPFIVSEMSGLEEDAIQDIIRYCVAIGLFDKGIFEQHQVLTSRGIQERYMTFCAVTKRKLPSNTPYLLVTLKNNQVSSEKTGVSSEETGVNSEETPNKSNKFGVNAEEPPINSVKSTQSKVKESKDNNSLRSSLSPSTPPPPARAREAGEWEIGEEGSEVLAPDGPLTASQGVEMLKSDRDWLLQMQRKFKLEAERIVLWLDSFVVDCDCRGKQQHESLADVKQHFNDWMPKNAKSKSGGQGKRGTEQQATSPEKQWISCQAELCKSVSEDVSRQSFDLLDFQRYDPETKTLFLQVPSKETYEYIESNLVSVLAKVGRKYFGQNVFFKYYVPKSNLQNDDTKTV